MDRQTEIETVLWIDRQRLRRPMDRQTEIETMDRQTEIETVYG